MGLENRSIFFVKPLSWDLWLAIYGFFSFYEYRRLDSGTPRQRTISWFCIKTVLDQYLDLLPHHLFCTSGDIEEQSSKDGGSDMVTCGVLPNSRLYSEFSVMVHSTTTSTNH
ncbi:hypothetical protein Csa_018563 [Cucumis sativus]|nr:hypothetical protein Csa_018563 [Cucumis sativus]